MAPDDVESGFGSALSPVGRIPEGHHSPDHPGGERMTT